MAISPLPIAAVILMLFSSRARSNSAAVMAVLFVVFGVSLVGDAIQILGS